MNPCTADIGFDVGAHPTGATVIVYDVLTYCLDRVIRHLVIDTLKANRMRHVTRDGGLGALDAVQNVVTGDARVGGTVTKLTVFVASSTADALRVLQERTKEAITEDRKSV